MIVKPTVNELLEHAENRFALVIATSKRARQIAEEQKTLTDVNETSPVTLAANEIAESKVQIISSNIEKQDIAEEKTEIKQEKED